MATLLLATKAPAGAATHARRAIELDPTAGRGHALLAEALLETGDRAGAAAELERASALAPEDARVGVLRERLDAGEPKKRSSWIARLLEK